MSSVGPRSTPDPPWYTSGSVRSVAGGSAPRALRTSTMWLMYAEPSTHSYARGSGGAKRLSVHELARDLTALEALGEREQEGSDPLPVVEGRLQRGRRLRGSRKDLIVAPDDDERPVSARIPQRPELHGVGAYHDPAGASNPLSDVQSAITAAAGGSAEK